MNTPSVTGVCLLVMCRICICWSIAFIGLHAIHGWSAVICCGDCMRPARTPRLRVIGDISIDIEGAIECSLKATDPGNPVYVYLPEEDRIVDGVLGRGPVVLAVDNLPCELPKEASENFGDALVGFVVQIATNTVLQPLRSTQSSWTDSTCVDHPSR